MTIGFILVFALLALVAVVGAWKMVFSHHPVHSALYLVLNFAAVAGLYLMLGAPFIALVQVAVYAGAIMVLFLFIIMYLNLGLAQDVVEDRSRRWTMAGTVVVLAVLLLAGGAIGWAGASAGLSPAQIEAASEALEAGRPTPEGVPAGTQAAADAVAAMLRARALEAAPLTSVEAIGLELFGSYVLPFEIASLLLLVAMIGVLVIARPEIRRESDRKEEIQS